MGDLELPPVGVTRGQGGQTEGPVKPVSGKEITQVAMKSLKSAAESSKTPDPVARGRVSLTAYDLANVARAITRQKVGTVPPLPQDAGPITSAGQRIKNAEELEKSGIQALRDVAEGDKRLGGPQGHLIPLLPTKLSGG